MILSCTGARCTGYDFDVPISLIYGPSADQNPFPERKPETMKNLFEAATVQEVKQRMANLRPDSARQWGKMNAAQAVAHCTAGLEIALGDRRPPRALIGRILGPIVKSKAFREEEPMRRNSPTVQGLVVNDERDLGTERERLSRMIDRFAAAGPQGCTTHPHSFFGPLTPDEWAALMYKHLDHHLGQFGA
jgi:Protein of unknown function (DUF1569)